MIIKNIENLIVNKVFIFSILTCFILTFSLNSYAQKFFKTSRDFDLATQQNNNVLYSTVKPILPNQYKNVDTNFYYIDTLNKNSTFKNIVYWSKKHFFQSDFLYFFKTDTVSNKKISIVANPIFIFESCKDKNEDEQKNYSKNTRGFEVFGQIGNRFNYYTAFYENQGYFPQYQTDYITSTGVIPGQGVGKEYKTDGLDWAWSTGYLYFKASDNLEFTFGYGKNFIGSGYQSIILSDRAFNYPFLRAQYRFKNFYYNVLVAQMQTKGYGFEPFENHRYRYANYHTLGYASDFLNGFNVSVTEGVMWRNVKDNGDYTAYPQILTFLPIISLPTIFNGLNGEDNVFWAFDACFSPLKYVKIYGQMRFDGKDEYPDDEDKHFGGQVGIHFFDILGNFVNRKYVDWHLQAEINFNNLKQTDLKKDYNLFAHYAEPLQFSSTKEKIFLSEITFLQRLECDFKYLENDYRKLSDFKISLIANTTTRWKIYVGVLSRNPVNGDNAKYIYFGTSICPMNLYVNDL